MDVANINLRNVYKRYLPFFLTILGSFSSKVFTSAKRAKKFSRSIKKYIIFSYFKTVEKATKISPNNSYSQKP
jgi:hypothetical protein